MTHQEIENALVKCQLHLLPLSEERRKAHAQSFDAIMLLYVRDLVGHELYRFLLHGLVCKVHEDIVHNYRKL